MALSTPDMTEMTKNEIKDEVKENDTKEQEPLVVTNANDTKEEEVEIILESGDKTGELDQSQQGAEDVMVPKVDTVVTKDLQFTTTDNPFSVRLLQNLGGRYTHSMRRSVQTVVLYEANRCLKGRYHVLRPFQRRVALYDTARDIIDTLDFILPYHRAEIMFRTAAAQVPLSPELTWRRMKVIEREIKNKIIPKIKPFFDKNKTHDEVCNAYMQCEYQHHATSILGKHPPSHHISIFLVYKMYYSGDEVNPNNPPARDPNPNRVVPVKKPPLGSYPGQIIDTPITPARDHKRVFDVNDRVSFEVTPSSEHLTPAEKRCKVLQEVSEHLELLKEFEGIISTEELDQRKRELFSALPPAPEKFEVENSDKPDSKICTESSITPEPKLS